MHIIYNFFEWLYTIPWYETCQNVINQYPIGLFAFFFIARNISMHISLHNKVAFCIRLINRNEFPEADFAFLKCCQIVLQYILY